MNQGTLSGIPIINLFGTEFWKNPVIHYLIDIWVQLKWNAISCG
jgi:hypothetical protein